MAESQNKARKKTRWGAALSLLVIVAVYFVLRSSIFEIKKIEIVTDSSKLREELQKDSKALLGSSLFELEPAEIVKASTTKHPRVQSLLVRRQWPSTLVLQVRERKPVALVFRRLGKEQQLWQIDADNVAFEKGLAVLPLFFPTPTDKAKESAVLKWLGSAKTGNVNGLAWDRDVGLIVETRDRLKIILGHSDYDARWNRAIESQNFLKSKSINVRRIDATYNSRVVISL